MIVKAIKSEWFQDYRLPSMLVAFARCSFKCEAGRGKKFCHNSHLATAPDIDIDASLIVEKYLKDPITTAIVCAGLEPMDQFGELADLIYTLREKYQCNDKVIIYTGYYEDEISDKIDALRKYGNIIVKFGRFIPNDSKRYDDLLGVYLASKNQYAKEI